MCRHLAYLGPAVPLRDLIITPPAGLYRQSWQPRMQRYGTVNADGFGVGWYAEGDPVPARYRRAVPIWADPSFADVARVVRSGAVLAAVRSATDGTAPDEASAAPYTADRWLFSHNGALPGWPAALGGLAATLPPEDLLCLEARCDSALVWGLVLNRLRGGVPPGEALASTVRDIAGPAPDSRLNLLLTDGTTVAATTWGDTLFVRHEAGTLVLVASEPSDDGEGWAPVPDRCLLLADPRHIRITPITPTGPLDSTGPFDPAASSDPVSPPASAPPPAPASSAPGSTPGGPTSGRTSRV